MLKHLLPFLLVFLVSLYFPVNIVASSNVLLMGILYFVYRIAEKVINNK